MKLVVLLALGLFMISLQMKVGKTYVPTLLGRLSFFRLPVILRTKNPRLFYFIITGQLLVMILWALQLIRNA